MKPHVAHSYDEIVRHTVPDPGSFRPQPPPSEAELQFDRHLGCAISAALIEIGSATLSFEVGRGRVILRGWVRDSATGSRIKRLVAEAAPGAAIESRLKIGPGSA